MEKIKEKKEKKKRKAVELQFATDSLDMATSSVKLRHDGTIFLPVNDF